MDEKVTILVVEDEPSLRLLVRKVLERTGFEVLEAPSGKSALELWDKGKPHIDLLLTDMVMPDGISGADLVERLQNSQPGLKVVFTSGYTASEVNQKMLGRTRASFLAKPYTHVELARAVRDCLDQNNGKDAAGR